MELTDLDYDFTKLSTASNISYKLVSAIESCEVSTTFTPFHQVQPWLIRFTSLYIPLKQ